MTARDSPASRRSRRLSQTLSPPLVAVRSSSTTVRPPTPSQDQATARKVTAATSRQSTPRPSRMRGTDGAPRRARGGAATVAASYGGTGPGTAAARSRAINASAACRVANSSWTTAPVSGSPQVGQAVGCGGRVVEQSGQRDGSA